MRTCYLAQELHSMFCGDLNGEEIQKRDVCIHTTDSLCGPVETNTILYSIYAPIKIIYIAMRAKLRLYQKLKEVKLTRFLL